MYQVFGFSVLGVGGGGGVWGHRREGGLRQITPAAKSL
jgi:hypothetical protein